MSVAPVLARPPAPVAGYAGLDLLATAVLIVDAAGSIGYANEAAEVLLETSRRHLVGHSAQRLFGDEQQFERLKAAAGAGDVGQLRHVVELRRNLREPVLVQALVSALGADDGGMLLEMIEIEQQLRHSRGDRQLGLSEANRHLLRNLAHEVRNPLGGIRGAAEILCARASDPRARDAASLIVREVDRIATLVDDLMVFKQHASIELAPLNIHRVLDEVLDLLSMDALAAGVKLVREFDPSIPEILGDANRLVQVFLNLARNALQALDGEGRLLIETRTTLDHRLGAVSGPRLPGVVVSVEDDGPGIPPELRAKVTTPFFSTRRGGTGLGLAVAGHWVALHGGTLRIGDAPGGGTRVRVSLPLRRAGAENSS